MPNESVGESLFIGLISSAWPVIYIVGYAIVGLIAAIAVYADAKKRSNLVLELHPIWWAVCVGILGPLFGVAVYWLLHLSKFATPEANQN